MTEKQIKMKALTLLKRAKRWFTTKDRLVLDWNHTYENEGGEELDEDCGACRACIIGGLYVANQDTYPLEVWQVADGMLLAQAGEKFDFARPRSLSQVQSFYEGAIRRLEKELAQPAPRRSR